MSDFEMTPEMWAAGRQVVAMLTAYHNGVPVSPLVLELSEAELYECFATLLGMLAAAIDQQSAAKGIPTSEFLATLGSRIAAERIDE